MTTPTTFDRRKFIKTAAVAGSAAVGATSLSSCSKGSDKLTMATVTEKGQIDSDAFYKKWLATFTKRTGIEVELRTYPFDQYANSVQLLFSQNSAPDVFRSAGTDIAHPVPYVRGWEKPLTKYATDKWKSNWPDGSFQPKISGLHVGNELYAAPFASNGGCRELYCNSQVMEKYGVTEPPKTWSEFEDAVLKITTDSKRSVFGYYPIGGATEAELQSTSGPALSGLGPSAVNLTTGKADAANPQMVKLMNMLQGLNSSGAFLTGWESKQGQQSEQMWAALAEGKVAMAIGSNWYYREMLRLKSDIPLEMVSAPVPDEGRAGYNAKPSVFLPFWHMGARTEAPESAWKLIEFLSSPEVMIAYYKIARRNPPALPKAKFADITDKWDDKMFEIQAKTTRLGPSPMMHTVNAASVQGKITAAQPQPVFADMQTLSMTRKKEKYDYASTATNFDTAYEKVIDEQIAKAGLDDVTRDTFVFSDWDPLKDYTPEGVTQPDWD